MVDNRHMPHIHRVVSHVCISVFTYVSRCICQKKLLIHRIGNCDLILNQVCDIDTTFL